MMTEIPLIGKVSTEKLIAIGMILAAGLTIGKTWKSKK